MAQYKVPQDVEAEDKLLGPFTFRQFVYLMIGAICIAATWGAFQIFPLLAIIPLPIGVFFIVLALPLRKDQPMETYLAAIINFRLKPNKRLWTPGQSESTILITAPKVKEESRTRDLTEDEASHRLSFLASIVDTEGQAIRGSLTSSMKEEYVAEANQVSDMMDANTMAIDQKLAAEQAGRRQAAISNMQATLNPGYAQVAPTQTNPAMQQQMLQNQMNTLANNNDYSVQTIAAEANRIQNQMNPVQPAYQQPNQPIYQPQFNQQMGGAAPAIYSPGQQF